MLNYWWVSRPKRRLNPVIDILADCSEAFLDQEWQGQVGAHLSLEDALEKSGLKRVGERRDRLGGRGGGGGRTYLSWLASLGLIFRHEASGNIQLTLAGEALLNGEPPVEILKHQILKYQFPSPVSMSLQSSRVRVHERFHIRPFRFLLRLLYDDRIGHLTVEEVAKIVVTEAENERDETFEYIVRRIQQFRERGDACLQDDFITRYAPSSGRVNPDHPYSHLEDLADTLLDWIDYTQLVMCERNPKSVLILYNRRDDVQRILEATPPFIPYPEQQELFQRKYGLAPGQVRDNRNFANSQTVTPAMIAQRQIQREYLAQAALMPITRITATLVSTIAHSTGLSERIVSDTLYRLYPRGSIGSFMVGYHEMAFSGREEATPFEKATCSIFQDVFGLTAKHVGPLGRTPDVLLLSDEDGYQAIIDNKAYPIYSISNDHKNRMAVNYIAMFSRYRISAEYPLAFFSYIAGGFSGGIDTHIRELVGLSHTSGSAMPVGTFIRMIEEHTRNPYSHRRIREIFSLNRQVLPTDL